MNKYNLILDNSQCDLNIMWDLLKIRKSRPSFFNEHIQKIAFYFMFPYSIWSISNSKGCYNPSEKILGDINTLTDNECDIYFEFENTNLQEKHFHDKYSNLVMNIAKEKPINAVVYNNDLALYIKKNYPNVRLIQSAIKNNIEIESPYKMNIIDYKSYKNNKSLIKNKDSYILGVNSFCKNSYFCTDYLSNSKLTYEINKPNICINNVNTFKEMIKNELFVSLAAMNNICNEGIKNFFVKCNSNNIFERIETYLYYVIKSEYIDIVRLELLQYFDKRKL